MSLFIGWLVVAALMRSAYSTIMWLLGLVTLFVLAAPAALASLDPNAAAEGWSPSGHAWTVLAAYAVVALLRLAVSAVMASD